MRLSDEQRRAYRRQAEDYYNEDSRLLQEHVYHDQCVEFGAECLAKAGRDRDKATGGTETEYAARRERWLSDNDRGNLPEGAEVWLCTPDTTMNATDWGMWSWRLPERFGGAWDGYASSERDAIETAFHVADALGSRPTETEAQARERRVAWAADYAARGCLGDLYCKACAHTDLVAAMTAEARHQKGESDGE